MRRAALAALAVTAACRAHVTPSNVKAPEAGVSIALYAADGGEGFGVVDDRRWLDVSGSTLLLANIDPGAELASLVIEPADAALRVGACTRERMPDLPAKDPLEEYAKQQREKRIELRHLPIPRRYRDREPIHVELPKPAPDDDRFVPVVRCAVQAKPGRYLVRILYVTKTLGYRAQHDIEVDDDKQAHVTSRFAIVTPVWQTRAEIALYEGVPGGAHAPHEVARGTVNLDGSTAVLTVATTSVASKLLRVYEGAVVTSTDTTDIAWGHDSAQAIWVWLELAKLRLAPGPAHVHLDLASDGVRDLDVPAEGRKQDDAPDAPLRLKLWVDESLRGSRVRTPEANDGGTITERFVFSVANSGEVAREIIVEEPMRTATRRRLERAWPKKPTAEHNVLRTTLVVKPGRIERAGFTMTYDF